MPSDFVFGGALTPASYTLGEPKIAIVPLSAGVDTGGGIFSWQNPEGAAICVTGLEIDLETIASAACTADFGTTAVSGTTKVDNLIDGQDLHSATGLFNIGENHGTNGKSVQRLAAGGWVTGSTASGASAGLAGNAYIHYHVLS